MLQKGTLQYLESCKRKDNILSNSMYLIANFFEQNFTHSKAGKSLSSGLKVISSKGYSFNKEFNPKL